MSEKRCRPNQNCCCQACPELHRENDRKEPFRRVRDQGQDTLTLAYYSGDICRADITATEPLSHQSLTSIRE